MGTQSESVRGGGGSPCSKIKGKGSWGGENEAYVKKSAKSETNA